MDLMKIDMKMLNAPLKMLDNQNIRIGIIIFLIVLGAGIVPMLNNTILSILTNPVVKVLVLLLIVYIAQKDLTISLLLAVVYVLMLNLVRENMGIIKEIDEQVQELEGELRQDLTGDELENLKGANTKVNCVGRASTGGDLTEPCQGFSALPNSLNSQGLNSVLGNPGKMCGAKFN